MPGKFQQAQKQRNNFKSRKNSQNRIYEIAAQIFRTSGAETGQRQKLQRQDRKNTGHEIENKAAQNRRKQQGQRQTAGTVVKDGRLFDSYGFAQKCHIIQPGGNFKSFAGKFLSGILRLDTRGNAEIADSQPWPPKGNIIRTFDIDVKIVQLLVGIKLKTQNLTSVLAGFINDGLFETEHGGFVPRQKIKALNDEVIYRRIETLAGLQIQFRVYMHGTTFQLQAAKRKIGAGLEL